MGCGSSKEGEESLNYRSFPDNIMALYSCAGQNKIIDISNKYLKEPLNLSEEIYDFTCISLKTDLIKENINNYNTTINKLIIIADIVSTEGVQLITKILQQIQISEEKQVVMIITPTNSTDSQFNGNKLTPYQLVISIGHIKQSIRIVFIERSSWYFVNQKQQQQIVAEILEQNTNNYYPRGDKTRIELKEYIEDAYQTIFLNKEGAHSVMNHGFEEADFNAGLEILVNRLNIEFSGEEQGFNQNLIKTHQSQIIAPALRMSSEIIIIPVGPEAQNLIQLIQNITLKDRITNLDTLLDENTTFSGKNREFMYIIDGNTLIDERMLNGKLQDQFPINTSLVFLIFPEKISDYVKLIPLMNALIDLYDLVIFLKPNEPKNAEIINAMVNIKGTLSVMVEHLVSFPRLHFVFPYYNLKEKHPLNVSIDEQYTIFSAVTVGAPLKIPVYSYSEKKFFTAKTARFESTQKGFAQLIDIIQGQNFEESKQICQNYYGIQNNYEEFEQFSYNLEDLKLEHIQHMNHEYEAVIQIEEEDAIEEEDGEEDQEEYQQLQQQEQQQQTLSNTNIHKDQQQIKQQN